MTTLPAGDPTNNTEMFKTQIDFFLSKPLGIGQIMTWINTSMNDNANRLNSYLKGSRI